MTPSAPQVRPFRDSTEEEAAAGSPESDAPSASEPDEESTAGDFSFATEDGERALPPGAMAPEIDTTSSVIEMDLSPTSQNAEAPAAASPHSAAAAPTQKGAAAPTPQVAVSPAPQVAVSPAPQTAASPVPQNAASPAQQKANAPAPA